MSWKIAPIGRGGDLLYSQAGTPSLDLRFAEKKALTDYVSGTNLVTFSRSSSAGDATYVDSDGLIKRAKVNLKLYSGAWNALGWQQQVMSPQPTNVNLLAPDNTATGWEWPLSATGYIQHLVTIKAATPYTLSFYSKQNALTAVGGYNGPLDAARDPLGVIYDWTTDTLAPGWSYTDAPNGWRRFSKTYTSVTSTTFAVRLNSNQGGYFWGFQLEEGSTATDYIPTTSSPGGAPRFDHDPTTGESLGLLVEEQRTNLVTASSDIAGYFTEQNSTATADASTAPDGTTTADLIVPSTTIATHASYILSLSFTPNTTYTYSIFVKPNGYNWLQLAFTSGFNNSAAWVNFNLTGAGSFGFTGGGELSKSIQAYPNGWYRCTIIATSGPSASTGGPAFIALDSDRNARDPNYAGNNTSGIYVWGAQVELGSFPTSYIPTSGATATRAADVAQITGTNFSSWYNGSAGTVYAEGGPTYAAAQDQMLFNITGSPLFSNHASIYYNQSGQTAYKIVNNGIATSILIFGSPSPQDSKHAVSYDLNGKSYSRNGATALTAASTLNFTADTLQVGSYDSGFGSLFGHIKRLSYFPVRLPDATLQTITT